tara:strand:- start:708 stop:1388 length:681 start_codon:yes stop_codon:yes gene_type:complete
MKKNYCNLKGIIFDLDGTLNRSKLYYELYEKQVFVLLSSFLNKSIEDVLKILHKNGYLENYGLTSIIRKLGIDSTYFYNLLSNDLEISKIILKDDKMSDTLLQLQQMGFSLAVSSNSGRSIVSSILKALDIESYFQIIATSDETDLKPSPNPYLYTLGKLNLKPNDCVYVGDRIEMEINTAKNLGMMTIFIKSYLLEKENTNYDLVDYMINTPYEIPDLLLGLKKM